MKYWMVMSYQPGQVKPYEKVFCARRDWADDLAAKKNSVAKNHSVVCPVEVPNGFLRQKYSYPFEPLAA